MRCYLPKLNNKKIKAMKIIIAYPFGVLCISILLNLLLLDINSIKVSMPSTPITYAIAITAVLFVINHSWLMTATELVRVKYRLYATPEEWQASGSRSDTISQTAKQELDRTHNAHRNTTENTVYFLLLLIPFVFSTPPENTVYIWTIGFALARLGYTYSYLYGKDNLRGAFMTLSLIAMYGVASYLMLGMIR